MIPDEISNLSLATCLGISERRVAQVRAEGRLPISPDGGHLCLRTLIRRGWQASLGQAEGPASAKNRPGVPNFAEERAKREAAEASLAEIKLAEKQREMVKVDAVSQAATSVMGRAMARLFDAWPQVAVELASMSNPAAITDRLVDEQKRVMGRIHAEFMADAAARSAE